MKTILVALLLLQVFQANAKNKKVAPDLTQIKSETSVLISVDDKYKLFETVKKDGATVSATCAQKCSAVTALQAKKKNFPKAPHPSLQHPAAVYCKELGGKNLIAKNKTGGDQDVCYFADASFVDSWQLFYKHYPKESVK